MGGDEVARAGILLLDDQSLEAVLRALSLVLRAAAKEQHCAQRLTGATSSTVLMADVFTVPKLHECCSNYLSLFQYCALKAVHEAVVEGMGSV